MTLAYSIVGDGPTVFLIHGVCHRRQAWGPIVDRLRDHRRVVTLDLPGHGESPMVADDVDALPYSLDLVADFITEHTPEGEKPHLVGNSLGGWAALQLGNRGLARSVTAISPAGFFTSPLDQRRAVTVFQLLRTVARLLLPLVPVISRSAIGRSLFMAVFCARPWNYPAEWMTVDAPALVANTVVDRGLTADFSFSEPTDPGLPITIGWGTFDVVLPFRESRLVPRHFPNAELIPLRRLGHVPMTDDPDRIASLILESDAASGKITP